MGSLIEKVMPPPGWRTPVIIVLGIFFGIGGYLFVASNAVSYLSDAPETCVNCHIMNPQYATWKHSSHRENATCNDCHVPHNNVVNKYFFKAMDGMRHATVFTMRGEPQVIHIKEAGAAVVQQNCIRCHSHVNENVSNRVAFADVVEHGEGKLCWQCHREVPHGRVNSLSSAPFPPSNR
jgi:cytochrome c nitrite reductase small subunit